NPTLATEYVGHNAQATVARYSPSGFYIASGDIHGNVRIWDTVGEENILKSEIRPISNKISDIAWDSESKRIIAVGDGKERFGHAFLFDTLSSVGEITGHSKVINSVSIRQQRPFRAVTASDDMTVSFFHGVPFKYNKTIRDHTRFIHAVEFSPNGDFFVSVGADGKIFLYDGKTGDKVEELNVDDGHNGGIFSVSWSPDSTQILTSSADCTAKVWDINAKKVINTFEFGSSSVENQQVGNLWQNDWLISTSLSGEFNYLDKNSGKVSRTIDGHSKAITSLAVTPDDTLLTGSYDGRIYSWSYGKDTDHTQAVRLDGENHSNQVTSLAVGDGSGVSSFFSVGMDDTLRKGDAVTKKFDNKTISTGTLPKSLSVTSDAQVVAVSTVNNVQLYDSELKKLGQVDDLGFTPTSVEIDQKGEKVFVGGDDNKVHVYDRKDGELVSKTELTNNSGSITALASHPTENHLLAVGDSVGKIYVYDITTSTPTIRSWVFHSARITSLKWSACGKFLVSGSIDTNIYVWNREAPSKKVAIKNAHVDAVNSVSFLNTSKDELQVVSVGQDAAVHIYSITKPE
ncbi:hypothetical protein BJ944DRAFT_168717, partial [Cunninghamella echinulata]